MKDDGVELVVAALALALILGLVQAGVAMGYIKESNVKQFMSTFDDDD